VVTQLKKVNNKVVTLNAQTRDTQTGKGSVRAKGDECRRPADRGSVMSAA
jgi:hypothetical protein